MANLHSRTNQKIILLLSCLCAWQAVTPRTLCASCRAFIPNYNLITKIHPLQQPISNTEGNHTGPTNRPADSRPIPLGCHCFCTYISNENHISNIASEYRLVENVICHDVTNSFYNDIYRLDILDRTLYHNQASKSQCVTLCRFHL